VELVFIVVSGFASALRSGPAAALSRAEEGVETGLPFPTLVPLSRAWKTEVQAEAQIRF